MIVDRLEDGDGLRRLVDSAFVMIWCDLEGRKHVQRGWNARVTLR